MQDAQAIISKKNFEKIIWETSETLVSYPEACRRMTEHQHAMHAEAAEEKVWLLEHPRLYTAGTSARPDDLLNPDGLPVYQSGRGGQWTYHGPGQRIAYIMLDLNKPHRTTPARDLRHFVADLESWITRTLAQFDVTAGIRPGRVGVWTQDPVTGKEAKIAAIGLRVSRWMTTHGVSINLAPSLQDFEGIVPCGLRDYGVTSLSRFQPNATMPQLDAAMARAWEDQFGATPIMRPAPP